MSETPPPSAPSSPSGPPRKRRRRRRPGGDRPSAGQPAQGQQRPPAHDQSASSPTRALQGFPQPSSTSVTTEKQSTFSQTESPATGSEEQGSKRRRRRRRGGESGRSGEASVPQGSSDKEAARTATPAGPGRRPERNPERGRSASHASQSGQGAASPGQNARTPHSGGGRPSSERSSGKVSRANPPAANRARPTPVTASAIDEGWGDDPALTEAVHPTKISWDEPSHGFSEADASAEDHHADEDVMKTLTADLPQEQADSDPSTWHLTTQEKEPNFALPVTFLIGVRLGVGSRTLLCSGSDADYRVGDSVRVESDKEGFRVGVVTSIVGQVAVPKNVQVRRILGLAQAVPQNADPKQNRIMLNQARDTAKALGLPVKVFKVEQIKNKKSALVYFSTEEKIDFRTFLQKLSNNLKVRVELKQTGVRDEAKIVGGIGSCGLELCCSTWLPAFVPVSIKNAKDQGLVLNPTKVSGQCGRLKCCLVYEQDTYAEMRKGLPKMGKRVTTPDGEGRVVEVDVLKQRIRVSLVTGDFKVYPAPEVSPMFPSVSGKSTSE